jgi:FixJ family two-component response regulator
MEAKHSCARDARYQRASGVGAIKEIRELDERAQIIVLTTFDGDEDIYRAIKAGAKAYLLKDTARDALVDCIRRLHAGETYLPPMLAAKLAERVSGEALSVREIEVLRRIAAGKSNKEIGAELFISEGHRENPRQKHLCQVGCGQSDRGRRNGNSPRLDSTLAKSLSPSQRLVGRHSRGGLSVELLSRKKEGAFAL